MWEWEWKGKRRAQSSKGVAIADVAVAVRILAQRSAAAAKEIKTLIGDFVDKVDIRPRLINQAIALRVTPTGPTAVRIAPLSLPRPATRGLLRIR